MIRFALLALFFVSVASFATEVRFAQLKELVEKKNAKVTASKAWSEAAIEREKSFRRSFLPSLDLYTGHEDFKQGTAARRSQPMHGLEARVNLLNAWQDKTDGDVHALENERRKFEFQRVVSEELAKARSTYWEILYLRDLQGLIQASIEVNTKNLGAAKRRIQSGVATNSDRFEFEMNEVELRRLLAQTGMELNTKTRLLSLLIGATDAGALKFSEKLDHEHDYEAFVKHGMKDHEYLFKEQEIHAEQLEIRAKGKSRAWLPKVDAFAAYHQYNEREREGLSDPADRTEQVVGVRATINIASGFESRFESAALTKESKAARDISNFQKQEVEVHLQGELDELKLLHDQVHEAEENITRSERYYKLTQSEYGRGVKNSPDVLGASEKLFAMRQKRLEIVRDFQLAKAHVLSKIGR